MNQFSVALLGDGIFHRWGDECLELDEEFQRLYTHSTVKIYNHGLLGSRVGNGLWRIAADYEKDGIKRRHLSFINPTVVVVESFAYTQFWDNPEGLSEYRDLLRRIWDELEKTTTSKRLFCLAPPPIRDRFLDGARNFQNTSKAQRGRFADIVNNYLDEARNIAMDEGWPIADLGEELEKRIAGGDVHRRYVDGQDNLNLSRMGFQLAARVIVREIDNNRFIEEKIAK